MRCASLLEELQRHAANLTVRPIQADLVHFKGHMTSPAVDLILCMGDTLTHLSSTDAIGRLFHDIVATLRPQGRFIATFRDYRHPPAGNDRFSAAAWATGLWSRLLPGPRGMLMFEAGRGRRPSH